MSLQHILIVEDETKLAELLERYLQQAGYKTTVHHDGSQVVEYINSAEPDLILLDVMLPIKNGLDICKEVRQVSSIPIILTTARVEELDRLLGLELGADDYVCKPYSPREVVARVKAVLRRFTVGQNEQTSGPQAFQLDESRFKVIHGQQDIELTAVEFKLLKVLMDKPGAIYSREQLMNHIYHDNRIVGDRTIDSHIKKLRKKLATTIDSDIIHSVYGAGYKFEVMGD